MRWIVGLAAIAIVGTAIRLSAVVAPVRASADCDPGCDAADSTGAVPAGHSGTGMPDLNAIHAGVTDWKFDKGFELPEIPEPSGLCYCPLTNTIFVVDDGAADRQSGLYEIDLDGNYKRGVKLGTDLEGVTYCGANKLFYVADEKDETVHIVEPQELKVQGSFQVSREYKGKELLKAGGNGFEGIAWTDSVPLLGTNKDKIKLPSGGALLLANQDDPTELVLVWIAEIVPGTKARIGGCWTLPQRNVGELYVDTKHGELWVVNSWLNTTEILRLSDFWLNNTGSGDNPVNRWEVMPGMAQEGLTFDPQGRMWIGQDIGGVVRYVKP